MKEKVGLQLYSLRKIVSGENWGDVLKEVSDIGYDGVEFYRFYDKPASEVKTVLDDCGLKPISSHVGIDKLRENLGETLEYHKEIGCDTIIIPYLPSKHFESRDAIREISNELSGLAKKVKDQGFDFGYHNHFHEFFTLNGATAFEAFAEEIPDSVGLQPDVGHIRRAGIDPIGLLKELDNRFVSFHLKDVESKNEVDVQLGEGELTVEEFMKLGEKIKDVRLGDGVINIPAIIEFGKKLNVSWFIVEDESADDPMKAARSNYNYLKSL